MNKQKTRCGIGGCAKKSFWKFTIMGNRQIQYGRFEDYVLFRCINHKETITIDEKYILQVKMHTNIFG